MYLSALRSNEVIHGITSIISPQQAAFFAELVFCIDFTVTTASISSIPLSLPYRAKNRQFSPLKRTKTDDTQPKLSATCFVIQSCQTDAINSNFDELLSYEHPSKERPFLTYVSHARLKAGQYLSNRYDRAVIAIITRIDIFQPSLSIYLGLRPYPTGTALMDVGSIYDKLTPMDAI